MKLLLKKIMKYLFLFINEIIPKDPFRWIFLSTPDFSDNSKAFFEYVSMRHPHINCVWLCKNKDLVMMLRRHSINAYYLFSIRGIYEFLRGSVVVTTHNNNLSLVSLKQCYVSLWHGFGIKSIGFKDRNDFKRYLKIESLFKKIRVFPVSSNFAMGFFRSAFHVPKSSFLLSGQPRVCKLVSNNFSLTKSQVLSKLGISITEDVRIIVYLPTFRASNIRKDGKGDILEILSSKFFLKISKVLVENNAVLIIKLHPLEEQLVKQRIAMNSRTDTLLGLYKNVYLLQNDKLSKNLLDIYDLLKFTDILITDYSSVYVDFLVLDREIIFYPFDLNEYLRNRELELYPYEKWTPGPKAYTLKDLLTLLFETLNGTNPKMIRKYKFQRKKIMQLLYDYPQQQVCDEILKKICSCLDMCQKGT